jgi:hypothetical protein
VDSSEARAMPAWDISSPCELRTVNYYTRLRAASPSGTHKAGAVDYHPYRLFLPRGMASELVSSNCSPVYCAICIIQ